MRRRRAAVRQRIRLLTAHALGARCLHRHRRAAVAAQCDAAAHAAIAFAFTIEGGAAAEVAV